MSLNQRAQVNKVEHFYWPMGTNVLKDVPTSNRVIQGQAVVQESLTGVCSCLGEPHRGQGTSAGWGGGGGTGQLKFFKVFPAPI